MNQFPTNCYYCNKLLITNFKTANSPHFYAGKCNCEFPTSFNTHYIYIHTKYHIEFVYFIETYSNFHDLWLYELPPKEFLSDPFLKTTTILTHQELTISYLNSIAKTIIL